MAELNLLHEQHTRSFADLKFAYPVLSRRSRGISIGVNLNPDRVCNFDCIYCQVDRRSESETRFVEMDRLLDELNWLLDEALTGRLFETGKFTQVPAPLRRINDIAFAGDGEPTTFRNFDEIVSATAALKRAKGADQVKIVLITNASMFHRPGVERALATLDANQGEIWAKLEAGTAEYFQLIDRTTIPFQQILDNLLRAARVRPLVIQALFMRVAGSPPPDTEILAWLTRLREIIQQGGAIRLVQVYTVARRPAEDYVTPLTDAELEAIATQVRQLGLAAEVFGGTTGSS